MSEIEITQADREAAARFMDECNPYLGDCGMKNSLHLALRQAFARHRHEARAEAFRDVISRMSLWIELNEGDGWDDPLFEEPRNIAICSREIVIDALRSGEREG